MDKIQSYIGFAIKKGAALIGCGTIKSTKKRPCVILYTPNLSANSYSVLKSVSERTRCPLLQTEECEILQKKNCKAVAICDKSLADAIMKNLMYMPSEEK